MAWPGPHGHDFDGHADWSQVRDASQPAFPSLHSESFSPPDRVSQSSLYTAQTSLSLPPISFPFAHGEVTKSAGSWGETSADREYLPLGVSANIAASFDSPRNAHLAINGPLAQGPHQNASRPDPNSKLRRSKYGASDWEPHLPKIKRLYLAEDNSLKETMRIMEADGFTPSAKLYKEKFNELGWGKNLPNLTAHWMASKAEQRKTKDKDTVFQYNNREWSVARVQKSIQRAKTVEDDTFNPEAPTPFGLKYKTPPINSPSILNLSSPRFENATTGRWMPVPDSSTPQLPYLRLRWNGHSRKELEAMSGEARHLQEKGDLENAEAKYREVLAGLENLLSSTHEETLKATYQLAEFYAQTDRMSSADQVLDRLSRKLAQRWGPMHQKSLGHILHVTELLSDWYRTDEALTLLFRVLDIYQQDEFSEGSRTRDHLILPPIVNGQSDTPRRQANVALPPIELRGRYLPHTSDACAIDYQMGVARTMVRDKDEEAESFLLRLIKQCEAHPERLASQTLQLRCAIIDFYEQAEKTEELNAALEKVRNALWSTIERRPELTESLLTASLDVAKRHLSHQCFEDAKSIFQKLDSEVETAYGPDDGRTIWLIISIGKIYQNHCADWPAAQRWFEQALSAAMTSHGLRSELTQRLEDALEKQHYSYPVVSAEEISRAACTLCKVHSVGT